VILFFGYLIPLASGEFFCCEALIGFVRLDRAEVKLRAKAYFAHIWHQQEHVERARASDASLEIFTLDVDNRTQYA
jgi:hypothetical protein